MDMTGRRQNPDEISTAALRYTLGDHAGRNAQLDRLDAAKNPDIPAPATPGDRVRITAGHLTGHTGIVRPWTEAPDSRDAYAPAVSPDSHAAVELDGQTVDRWAYIAHENLRRIDDDTPASDAGNAAARPFQVGDRVRIVGWDTYGPHEGTITEILPGKMRTDGFLAGVPRPAYVVTDCEYTLDSGSTALACAALNEDLTGAGWYGGQIELIEPAESPGVDEHIRSHEPSCGATVHQWDGIDSGELGPCGQPATGTAIGQTGRPFSVCNEHADNTTPERCTSQYSGIQCDLPVHEGLHAEGEDGFVWDDAGHLVEHPHWDDERHIWVDDAETSPIDDGWGHVTIVSLWRAIRDGDVEARGEADLKIMNVLNLSRPPAEVAAMLRRVADVLDGGAK